MSIEFDFDFDEAKLQVEMLKADLQRKRETALRNICERLATLIEAYSFGVVADDLYREVRSKGKSAYIASPRLSKGFYCTYVVNKNSARMMVKGDKDMVFIEFGAGYGADNLNPLASDVSFFTYRGSYGWGLGELDRWHFTDEEGNKMMAKGTPSSKPIHRAIEQVKLELPNILRGVFG